jgi:hypothetical protein
MALAHGPTIRLLPRIVQENEFFWTSGSDGRLRFLRCRQCSTYVHPPAPRCPECLSEDVSPEVVSGRATVVAYTVNVQQWILVEVEPEEVRNGMAVEVVFEHHDDVYLPLFRPVATGTGTS